MTIFIFIWLLCGVIANNWAMNSHKASGIAWFVFGLICGPVVLVICIAEWATRSRHNGP